MKWKAVPATEGGICPHAVRSDCGRYQICGDFLQPPFLCWARNGAVWDGGTAFLLGRGNSREEAKQRCAEDALSRYP